KRKGIDRYSIGCFLVNGPSVEELINMDRDAMATGSLLVLLFHGVGGEHGINEPLAEHRKVMTFLKEHEQRIWIAPMVDICSYLQTEVQ
ncbi:MAG TPA: chitooligosaccharide deacetylase, partial [Bacteroidota bacterium]|nr:chitooligosaccharide deacetylase [Bacteroidota bacterium]